jgi:hypothetical protein
VKTIIGLCVAAALAGLSLSAHAQAPPPGSYRESCRDIRMQGPDLIAFCRRADGREQRTALDIAHCVGDIGNNDGNLVCNGGQPARPVAPPPAGYAPGPGYPAPGYAPPPPR